MPRNLNEQKKENLQNNAVIVGKISVGNKAGTVRFEKYPNAVMKSNIKMTSDARIPVSETSYMACVAAGISRTLASLPCDYAFKKKLLDKTLAKIKEKVENPQKQEQTYIMEISVPIATIVYNVHTRKLRIVCHLDYCLGLKNESMTTVEVLSNVYVEYLNNTYENEMDKKIALNSILINISKDFEIEYASQMSKAKHAQIYKIEELRY